MHKANKWGDKQFTKKIRKRITFPDSDQPMDREIVFLPGGALLAGPTKR